MFVFIIVYCACNVLGYFVDYRLVHNPRYMYPDDCYNIAPLITLETDNLFDIFKIYQCLATNMLSESTHQMYIIRVCC